MKENNVTITIRLSISDETWNHVRLIENLDDILKRASEKKLYSLVLEYL